MHKCESFNSELSNQFLVFGPLVSEVQKHFSLDYAVLMETVCQMPRSYLDWHLLRQILTTYHCLCTTNTHSSWAAYVGRLFHHFPTSPTEKDVWTDLIEQCLYTVHLLNKNKTLFLPSFILNIPLVFLRIVLLIFNSSIAEIKFYHCFPQFLLNHNDG